MVSTADKSATVFSQFFLQMQPKLAGWPAKLTAFKRLCRYASSPGNRSHC